MPCPEEFYREPVLSCFLLDLARCYALAQIAPFALLMHVHVSFSTIECIAFYVLCIDVHYTCPFFQACALF